MPCVLSVTWQVSSVDKCINCYAPCVAGSSYCEPCDAPIYESAMELFEEYLAEESE
jgi:hypothetical protein